ncbi:TetR/AcrR family transcriptional regulator [Nitriliruptor alkaliphilus]|uniref:TetR/AcrR family transcriptional regulator n=1 Tax=Nitriliruptor alkaliphilus TaxID=427918 RepID=UPI0006969A9E|nr:TetR/AcrR family transcriptional regulator [Nitriliruptor alkaliphilus]
MTTRRASSETVRSELLDAAVGCLLTTGYAQVSTRAVADAAGVPVSQIHYHFGGKDGLFLEVLDHLDRQLLQRQRTMYGQDEPLWRRWEQACDFLAEDLASGYVRVLQELIAAGYADPGVAERVREQLQGWLALLTSVAEEAAATVGLPGMSPRQVALLVGCTFLGAEEVELLGLVEDGEVRAALRAVGDAIRRAEEGP